MTELDAAAKEISRLQARVAELEQQLKQASASTIPMRSGGVIGTDQLRAVFENYSGGMAFSRDGILIDVNPGLCRLMRRSADEVLGHPIIEFVAPEDREIVRQHVLEGYTLPYECRLLRPDGSTLECESSASIVPADGGNLRFTVLRDISAQRRSEAELDRQRRMLQAILDYMPAGVFVIDVPSGKKILTNQKSLEILRRDPDVDIYTAELANVYSAYVHGTEQLYPIERMPIVRAMTGEISSVDDIEIHHADGTRTLLHVVGAPIYDSTGRIVLSVAITQDITARKQAEDTLHKEQEFLRGLIKSNERDRQLMAYEIHDGLVQYITGAVWQLEALEQDTSVSATIRATLSYTQQLLRHAIVDGRRVLSGLRPPVLDEHGILAAIDYLAAEHQHASTNKLTVETSHEVPFQRLEPLLEGAIFRIVQEALHNVRKHSEATRASVRLEQHDERIRVSVVDNGRGFLVDQVPSDRFGLQGIRKRAELLGGLATIVSTPGKGTSIDVDLPLLPFRPQASLASE
jgi:PAS domain S-box-containing protein